MLQLFLPARIPIHAAQTPTKPMKKLNITLIICYYGDWPEWFPIFLQTCSYNPTIDFLIFSNCAPAFRQYDNVRFVGSDLAAFRALASEKLGLAVTIEEPYKLCDFKPAYGVIFEDYLGEADFWGHCDIDIVLGDIRRFVDELLVGHDVITAKKEYLLGSFTLYRNDPEINRLYEKSKDHATVFGSPAHFCFDECNFLWWNLLAGLPIANLKWEIDSMSHVVKRMHQAGSIKAFFETLVLEQDELDEEGNLVDWKDQLLWQDGRLINLRNNKEYLYFHFHFLKDNETFRIPRWEGEPKSFYMAETGFSLSLPGADR